MKGRVLAMGLALSMATCMTIEPRNAGIATSPVSDDEEETANGIATSPVAPDAGVDAPPSEE
jgi:hypothetical protein